MPDANDYGEHPEHPLYGVPQGVLDAARIATDGAERCHDLVGGMSHPVADAVVAEIISAGYVIIPRNDLPGGE